MSALRDQVIADLAAAELAPRHRLGQNFMVDAQALEFLVAELALPPVTEARVVEIGPGTGVLTDRLIPLVSGLLLVELDRGLAERLIRIHGGSTVVTVVEGDALQGKNRLHPAIEAFAERPWHLCSNLPYDIAIPALINAAMLPRPPQRAVVTVQWEAARRLCSHPGDEAWGASAASLQATGTARIVRRLGPSSFYPRPGVDSAILRWEPHDPAGASPAASAGFGRWCRRVFAARRKVLPRALRDAGLTREQADAACAACGLDPTRRLERLTVAELIALLARLGPLAADAPNDDDGA